MHKAVQTNPQRYVDWPVTILNWSFPREDILSWFNSFNQTCHQGRSTWPWSCRREDYPNRLRLLFVKLPLRRSDWYGDYLDWQSQPGALNSSATQIHTSHVLLRIYRYHPSYRQHGCGRFLWSKPFKPWNLGWTQSEKLPNRSRTWCLRYSLPRVPNERRNRPHHRSQTFAKVPSKKVWSTLTVVENTWYSRNQSSLVRLVEAAKAARQI